MEERLNMDVCIYEQHEATFSLKRKLLSIWGHLYEFDNWSFLCPEHLKSKPLFVLCHSVLCFIRQVRFRKGEKYE